MGERGVGGQTREHQQDVAIGLIHRKGATCTPEILENMASQLHHRGPDDRGVWICKKPDGLNIGLAHMRLAIIDLSQAGHQPMANEDGSIQVVFNGEIYNFLDLREPLASKGHTFRSRTDTEVLLHLYEEKGVQFLDNLRGMFTFAIWDGRKQTRNERTLTASAFSSPGRRRTHNRKSSQRETTG